MLFPESPKARRSSGVISLPCVRRKTLSIAARSLRPRNGGDAAKAKAFPAHLAESGFSLVVFYAEKLAIFSGHLAAVRFAEDNLHGLYNSGRKRSCSFPQSTAIFQGLDVVFDVHKSFEIAVPYS